MSKTRGAYTRGLQYKRKNEVSKIFIVSRVQQRGKGPIQKTFKFSAPYNEKQPAKLTNQIYNKHW